MTSHFAKQRGLNSEKIVNLGVYCALAGMLGAKLLMIALDPEYRAHPGEIFSMAALSLSCIGANWLSTMMRRRAANSSLGIACAMVAPLSSRARAP